jgi:hypothetical protein
MTRRGLAAAAALMLLLALLAWRSVVDVDVGIHLAGGRWIAEHGAVPDLDPFTYTVSDHAYVAYHWLFQLALHASERAAGATGMAALRFALLTATGALLAVVLRMRGASAGASAALGLLALLAAEWRFTLRPELVSWCLSAALLAVLERRPRGLALLLLPLIQAVWANTHVHALGLAIIGSYALEDAWQRRTLRTPLVAAAALAVLASLLNPYGVTGATQPLLLSTRFGAGNAFGEHIAELASPWLILPNPEQPFSNSAQLWSYRALFVLGVASLPLLLRARRLADAGIVVLFGALSALSVRNVALYAVVSLPALVRGLDLVLERVPRARDALLVAACGLALLQVPRVVSGTFYAGDRRTDRFAAELCGTCLALETADWLAQAAPSGRGLNNLALGSTLIWRDPAHPVFIDGRNEVSGEAFYLEYLDALAPEHFEAARRRWGFEYVALAHRGDERAVELSAYLARDPAWRLVHVDGAGVVFVRRGGPNDALPDAALPAPVDAREREQLFDAIEVHAGRAAALRRWLWSRERPPGAQHGLGNFLARIDRLEPAERPLLTSARRHPGFFEPHFDLGGLYQRAGMGKLALTSYRRALALAPGRPELAALRDALERAEAAGPAR